MLIFDGLTTYKMKCDFMIIILDLEIRQQTIFSRWMRSICNFMSTLTYHSVQCAKNYSASTMTSSLQHYATNSVTSYIIATCSYVFVTVSVSKVQRILQFAQSLWLCDYIELNKKFRTLILKKIYTNLMNN